MAKKKGGGGGGGGSGGGGGGEAKKAAAGVEMKEAKETKENGAGEKNNDGTITAVLKVDMHCEGCAKKIRKSIKGFEGVEGVKAEIASGKLTVVGKMDPWKLRERVETKTKKKVDLVSPIKPSKKDNKAPTANGDNQKPPNDPQKPNDNKKPKDKDKPPVVVTTVVLKMGLHCDGCIQRIRRAISKIKGVEQVVVDAEKDLVTVKGTMEAKALPEAVRVKLKRPVEVVTPKKAERNEKDEKKEKGEKKAEKEPEKPNPATAAAAAAAAAAAEMNRMDYYYGGYGPYGSRIELVHAPQLFSDENPNACSVM
ncbi:heavy metal-associated isoprenylated plant protein 3-like [Typha latifolia]|uniref:heavy metal-associated isoprenylated plant protein 3-like n=1 Tax=Typha latifolia TaxID=4733 RepID=UPI003C2AC717